MVLNPNVSVEQMNEGYTGTCLLYTSDAADEQYIV